MSRETGLPIRWSENKSIAWKTPLPEWGTSTPAIWGEAIFVTTHDELDGGRLLLIRIEKGTGKVVWTRQVGAGEANRTALNLKDGTTAKSQKFHRLHNLASPSPVTDGELVLAHFGNGDLAAYDFAGNQLWKRNLQSDHGEYTIWWGHANSPVIHQNLVISVCMQDALHERGEPLSPSYLVAHDRRTGEEKWKVMRMTNARAEECDSYTTPILYQNGDLTSMFIMGADQLDAYDPATGKQLWFLPGLAKSRIITGPTVGQGRVFATMGMRGPLLSVPLGGTGRRPPEDIAWRIDKGTPDSCSPVLWGTLLFIVSDNGIAQCLNSEDGEVLWQERLPGDYKASPIAADGNVYFINTNGLTTVIAASTRFRKLAENKIEDELIASPAISDSHIFLRGRKALYCVGREEK